MAIILDVTGSVPGRALQPPGRRGLCKRVLGITSSRGLIMGVPATRPSFHLCSVWRSHPFPSNPRLFRPVSAYWAPLCLFWLILLYISNIPPLLITQMSAVFVVMLCTALSNNWFSLLAFVFLLCTLRRFYQARIHRGGG